MFKRDSYTATYQGPVLASGETLRRSVSNAGAMRSFAGNERAYRQENAGVGAGSRAARHQMRMGAQQAMSQTPDHRSAYLQRLADNAETRLQYEGNTADERENLRRLLFDVDQTGITADMALRGDRQQNALGAESRRANTEIARQNRRGTITGFLGGLFG